MKTETSFYYNFSLKIADDKTLPEKTPLRIVEKENFKNQRFSFIDNEFISDCINWDSSWFANYE